MKRETEADETSIFGFPILERMFESVQEIHRLIREDSPRIEESIMRMDTDVRRALTEESDRSPAIRRIAYQRTLWAQYGWFLSTWNTPLSLLSQTAELLGSKKHNSAEEAIAEHFESEAELLFADLIKQNPERGEILNDVFVAHKKSMYTLSIPVMLAQADGIGSYFFGTDSIYTVSEKNLEKIRKRFEEAPNKVPISYVYFIIASLTPLNASRLKRTRYPQSLNRHAVLHGESTTYASRINSLKSISWLHFVSEMVNH